MSVDCVPVVLYHLPTDLALEWLTLSLAATVLVFVLSVRDVVLVLDVAIERSIVIEHLGTQSTGEETG